MNTYVSSRRGAQLVLQNLLGRTLWRLPFPFQIAKLAGPTYTLRCLLFHDISDRTSVFTEGLNVTLGSEDFESKIQFVTKHYDVMALQDFFDASRQNKLPARPAIITFDDAYASVALNAAPVLQRYKVPAVFFVISSLVGNHDLGLDNLICYVANTAGLKVVKAAAQEALGREVLELNVLDQVFDSLLPTISLEDIRKLHRALETATGIRASDLARESQLYVTAHQLKSLAHDGFEIGSHTHSHVFCRSLKGSEFPEQIGLCKTCLESITGKAVRTFSVPYGSPVDLTDELATYLSDSGHELVFLARNRSNTPTTSFNHLNRVDIHTGSDGDSFVEIEILPRLRSLADRLLGRNLSVHGYTANNKQPLKND